MKITVVTVAYNAADEIRPTLQSVADQSHDDIEYLIIDGASKDGTLSIVKEFTSIVTRLVSEPDKGIYDAMNKALRLATGEAIIFMNAGDYFYTPGVVATAAAYLEANPSADVIYGAIEVRATTGQTSVFMPPGPEQALEFLVEGSLPHQGTFARRRTFARTGPFDLRYRSHADYDWFLKVASDPGLTLERFDAIVASFGLGGTSSQLERGERERHSIQNGLAAFQSRDWLARRVEIYQEIYLRQRVELERLRSA